MGSIPGQGTKILQAAPPKKFKKKRVMDYGSHLERNVAPLAFFWTHAKWAWLWKYRNTYLWRAVRTDLTWDTPE